MARAMSSWASYNYENFSWGFNPHCVYLRDSSIFLGTQGFDYKLEHIPHTYNHSTKRDPK